MRTRRMRMSCKERKLMSRIARRGGRARALALSPERRREIALNAIHRRWARTKAGRGPQFGQAGQTTQVLDVETARGAPRQ